MKKYFTRPTLNEIFLFLYVFLVIFAQYFCNVGDNLHIFILFLLLLVSIVLTKILFQIFQKASIKAISPALSKEKKYFWIIGVFLFSMIILGAYYLAFFPESYSSDSYYQLSYATSGEYSDWHPVIHTLLFFTLPVKLFYSIDASNDLFFSCSVLFNIYN